MSTAVDELKADARVFDAWNRATGGIAVTLRAGWQFKPLRKGHRPCHTLFPHSIEGAKAILAEAIPCDCGVCSVPRFSGYTVTVDYCEEGKPPF